MRELLLSLICISARAYDWSIVDSTLESAIANKTFPGCVAAVSDATGQIVYSKAFGNFTYGDECPNGGNPQMSYTGSKFDMASVGASFRDAVNHADKQDNRLHNDSGTSLRYGSFESGHARDRCSRPRVWKQQQGGY